MTGRRRRATAVGARPRDPVLVPNGTDDAGPRLGADRSGQGPRLVLVHGFTQTRRSWDGIRADLDADHETVAVDAPGHGDSDLVRVDLADGAAALGRTAGRATYIGYSMGGRLALHLAVAAPDLVERLVLVSTTAGLDDPVDRTARRAADEALADQIEALGVPAFVEWWIGQPLFASLRRDRAGVDERLANTAAGLASSLRLAGTGTQVPMWDRLGDLAMPVLLVAGALDAKFVAAAERMAALLPAAELAVVPGAGHTVHLERPTRLPGGAARLARPLRRRGPGRWWSVARSPAATGRSRRARRSVPCRCAPPRIRRTGATASGIAASPSRAAGRHASAPMAMSTNDAAISPL